MVKLLKYIVSAVIVLWLIVFSTDFTLAKLNKAPIFAVPKVMYKDGGSAEYYGLGYKVNKYVYMNVVGTEMKTEIGTWSMPFSKPEQK